MAGWHKTMGHKTVWVSMVVALMTALACAHVAIAQVAVPLHTSGRFIVDSNGTRVHLNGVNWYGAESADFVVGGLQAQPLAAIVQQIKSMGFNVVRLPWSNQLYETNPVVGNYALAANPSLQGENALAILDQVISALTNAGIMVILDNHNSNAEWCCSTSDGNTLWYNSQYPQANWLADWQGIVARYQNNSMVIGADLRNEPRGTASWGGSASTDWHTAAIQGGNAVQSVNPNLLIFVEGVNYALDLSGAANLPVQLNVSNRLVYEAHDYGFDYSGLTGYSDYVGRITSKWGYLVTASNPQPLWVGEFGTCNTADTCVRSGSNGDNGYWFNLLTTYMQEYGIDWTYWAVNGTQSTGSSRGFGTVETYGVLNSMWSGAALSSLSSRLSSLTPAASVGVALIANSGTLTIARGSGASATVSIVPQNGFTGTVNLSCSVSGGPSSGAAPTCSVPSSQNIAGTGAVQVTVTISTTLSAENRMPKDRPRHQDWRTSGEFTLACVFVLFGGITRRSKRLERFLIVMLLAIPLLGCGGGGSMGGSTSGTTPGAYTITVTGTATSANSASTQIAVTVQ